MSLYYEAEAALQNADKAGGSLKSRIFGNKNAKHSPAQIYALVIEATKWSSTLKAVIERSELLRAEKKLTATLAILLVHDLLLSKRGIAAPKNHALHLAITRHQARLRAEFIKLRLRHGFASVDAFRTHVEQQAQKVDSENYTHYPHPRWVRINTLRTTLAMQLSTTFGNYEQVLKLEDVLFSTPGAQVYYIDEHVSDLIALPPNHNLSKADAYLTGQLIFQDKASCFPAVLLDPTSAVEGDVIDACAAPGNKTTHLAALMKDYAGISNERRIFAVERNASRSKILQKMVTQAGAQKEVSIIDSTDFLSLSTKDQRFQAVKSILLDPSCSGSGIVGRDDGPSLELPALPINRISNNAAKAGSKRKHAAVVTVNAVNEVKVTQDPDESDITNQRLESLSRFQLMLLLHAMSFPAAQRIVYSTCSVHVEENESVVIQALCSPIAVDRGWSSLVRDKQDAGMRLWDVRGDSTACQKLLTKDLEAKCGLSPSQVAAACIRCETATSKGTMGFFAAGFIRKNPIGASDATASVSDEASEWEGFGD